ncbi:hypothetical protein RHO14_05915 [Orbus wheelerorum]|uniref:hypothetical protein n=1 Tax=Orbus wheelerorum TaxID=3074111 RepID=UPI00370D5307
MKKLILTFSVILSLAGIVSPTYADNKGITEVILNTGIRLVYSSSNSFYHYCHYEMYRKDNGAIISSYVVPYNKWFFSGCPSR